MAVLGSVGGQWIAVAMSRLPKFLWLSAERVAEEGYRAVMRNDPIYVTGAVNRMIGGVAKLLPMRTARRLSRARSRLLDKRKRL